MLNEISTDLIRLLSLYLDVKDVLNLFLVNKKFNNFKNDEIIWYNLLHMNFTENEISNSKELFYSEYSEYSNKSNKKLFMFLYSLFKVEDKLKINLENVKHENIILICNLFSKITEIPKQINFFNCLQMIFLSNNEIKKIPKQLFELINLKTLNLSNNKIKKVQKKLYLLTNLEVLNLSNNNLTKFPIIMNPKLETLDLSSNYLKTIRIYTSSIKLLLVNNNQIKKLKHFENLRNLEILKLSNNKLKTLFNLQKLTELKELYISCNKFTKVPYQILSLNLKMIWLSNIYYPNDIPEFLANTITLR